MIRLAPVLITLPLLAAASAPVQPVSVPLDTQVQQARAEQFAAEAQAVPSSLSFQTGSIRQESPKLVASITRRSPGSR